MCCSDRNPSPDPTSSHSHPSNPQERKPCCASCAEKLAAPPPSGPHALSPRALPEIVYRVLHDGGRALDSVTRRAMEAHLRADLGDIRLHVDSRAAESAEAIGALAFAFGNHIVFGPGLYLPNDQFGRRILVHELAHCLQQSRSWSGRCAGPEAMYESAHDPFEAEAEALAAAHRDGRRRRDLQPISESPLRLACLGANPGCTPGQRAMVHQAIFDANAWVNNALKKLEAKPVPRIVVSALRRNFGNTYGVTANLQMLIDRIRHVRAAMNRMPVGCDSTHAFCVAGHCGFATPGTLGATLCAVSFGVGISGRLRSGCVLHESFHAAFSRFTVDHYSGRHGTIQSDATYPGTGVEPLLNADSYTTLVMDLS